MNNLHGGMRVVVDLYWVRVRIRIRVWSSLLPSAPLLELQGMGTVTSRPKLDRDVPLSPPPDLPSTHPQSTSTSTSTSSIFMEYAIPPPNFQGMGGGTGKGRGENGMVCDEMGWDGMGRHETG